MNEVVYSQLPPKSNKVIWVTKVDNSVDVKVFNNGWVSIFDLMKEKVELPVVDNSVAEELSTLKKRVDSLNKKVSELLKAEYVGSK